MGLLVDGKWQDRWYDTKENDGHFVRATSQFRSWIRADGSSRFPAEAGRYHLYVARACPWAHRTLIYRKLKGLEDAITVSIVDPLMLDEGWVFSDAEGCIPDEVNGKERLYEVYTLADPAYSGRVTVPLLWDKVQGTAVSNESSEIIRMFNHEMGDVANDRDFYPEEQRTEIDSLNDRIYETLNNGVYRCGFATKQAAYEEAFDALFDTLDFLEERLGERRYLLGDRPTEADWRLFPTLVRFDPVYFGHFKCNRQRLCDFPNLWGYTLDLYQHDGIAETVNLDHIKRHYYASHESVNPTRIVPKGPVIDYTAPHGRDSL